MEFCGYASHTKFPAECALQRLVNEFSDNSMIASNMPAPDFVVEIPTLKSLLNTVQSLMDGPMSKHISVGVVATALFCGIWAFKKSSKTNKPKSTTEPDIMPCISGLNVSSSYTESNCIGDHACHDASDLLKVKSPGFAFVNSGPNEKTISKSALQGFQRQLMDVLTKLEQARLRLNEIEGDKDLLVAELDIRQRALANLQTENKEEREKRQKAEMKMEIMEYENSHLKKMRRELTVKAGQLERLAKCVKEKEEYQEKLFEENVVVPRSVARARAKEFSDMQSRLQVLEARFFGIKDPNLETDISCVSRSASTTSSDDKPECSSSDHSFMKVRKVIRAPKWRLRSTSILSVTSDSPCSPIYVSRPVSPNKSVHLDDRSVVPSKSTDKLTEIQTNDLLCRSINKESPEKPTISRPNSDKIYKIRGNGFISQIKAFVKGHSDTSESCIALNPGFSPTKNKPITSVPARETEEAPPALATDEVSKRPVSEVRSIGSPTVFLSASCGSASADTSPYVVQKVFSSNNDTSMTKPSLQTKTNLVEPQNKTKDSETKSPDLELNPKQRSKPIGLVVHKSAMRQANKIKSFLSSKSMEFQIHYQSKSMEGKDFELRKKRKEDGESESDDSWCVILPK